MRLFFASTSLLCIHVSSLYLSQSLLHIDPAFSSHLSASRLHIDSRLLPIPDALPIPSLDCSKSAIHTALRQHPRSSAQRGVLCSGRRSTQCPTSAARSRTRRRACVTCVMHTTCSTRMEPAKTARRTRIPPHQGCSLALVSRREIVLGTAYDTKADEKSVENRARSPGRLTRRVVAMRVLGLRGKRRNICVLTRLFLAFVSFSRSDSAIFIVSSSGFLASSFSG